MLHHDRPDEVARLIVEHLDGALARERTDQGTDESPTNAPRGRRMHPRTRPVHRCG